MLTGLQGDVIEVGSGDGRSFEHYPAGVERLLAVEPDATARAAAAKRALDAATPIEVVEGSAEELPATDGEFDAAVLMGVLCSVHDPGAALGELRRILKPGGELRFWEHFAQAMLCSAHCSAPATRSSGRRHSGVARRRATRWPRFGPRDSRS